MYKISNKLIAIPDTRLQEPARSTRGLSNKFQVIGTSIDTVKFSFFPRTIPDWNKLSEATVCADTSDFRVWKTIRFVPSEHQNTISTVLDVLKGLSKIDYDIIEYYQSLKTDETPITNRKRMLLYTDDEMEAEADEYSGRLITTWRRKEEEDKTKYILPEMGPYYENIMTKTMKMHIEMKVKFPGKVSNRLDNWQIFIFDDPAIFQAMVLSNGHIYVSKQLIDSISDTHLAFMLSHEMSHIYMKHHNEQVSLKDFMLGFSWTVMGCIEKLVPSWGYDSKVMLIQKFQDVLMKQFPPDTLHESEADQVGLYLTSKARFDPIDSANFFDSISTNPGIEKKGQFNEIDGFDREFEMHYDNPAIPTNKAPWMEDYLNKMNKWEVDHPDLDTRDTSLKELVDKMLTVKKESDDERNRWKQRTGRAFTE